MISAVCVYNNEKILNNYLLKSLKNQTADYEIITLDNTQGKYKSAAEALNYGGRKAKGGYIMFVHQDIILGSDLWIEKAEKILDRLPNFGIAGVAGRCENDEGVITNIEHGIPKRVAGEIHIKKPIKVQTLDECLIIIPRFVFSLLQFDEKVCNDWHLYAVDYSLSIRRLGYNVYAVPMYVYHLSTGFKLIGKLERILRGPLPRGYYISLKKVLKKHKNYYEKIYINSGTYRTIYPVFLQRAQSIIKNRLKLLFKKIKVKKV